MIVERWLAGKLCIVYEARNAKFLVSLVLTQRPIHILTKRYQEQNTFNTILKIAATFVSEPYPTSKASMGSGGKTLIDLPKLTESWFPEGSEEFDFGAAVHHDLEACVASKKDGDDVKVKLTYFDAKARAELPRLIMAVAGIPFEDIRIKGEEWSDLKEGQDNGL